MLFGLKFIPNTPPSSNSVVEKVPVSNEFVSFSAERNTYYEVMNSSKMQHSTNQTPISAGPFTSDYKVYSPNKKPPSPF